VEVRIGSYKERVIDVCEDGVLGYHVINLLKFDDVCLLEDLHSEELIGLLILGQTHSSKRPYRDVRGWTTYQFQESLLGRSLTT
jgi:hypothetical protein